MWELSVVPSVRALDGLVFLFVCTTPDEGNFREGKDLLRLMDMGEGYSSLWWRRHGAWTSCKAANTYSIVLYVLVDTSIDPLDAGTEWEAYVS